VYPGYDPVRVAVIRKRERVLRSAQTPAQKAAAKRYAELADEWLARWDRKAGPLAKFFGIFAKN